jgi:uncharacterized OsmC-like protein
MTLLLLWVACSCLVITVKDYIADKNKPAENIDIEAEVNAEVEKMRFVQKINQLESEWLKKKV